MMKKIINTILSLTIFSFLLSTSMGIVNADICPYDSCSGRCTYEGQCVDNFKCVLTVQEQPYMTILDISNQPCGSAFIGGVSPPKGVDLFNWEALKDSSVVGKYIGIFYFVTAGLRLFFIIAGLLVFGNFIYAGYIYITQAGDSKAHTLVRERVTFSIVGLVVMVSAFIVASLAGAIVFGDAGFILNPSITQYGALERPQ